MQNAAIISPRHPRTSRDRRVFQDGGNDVGWFSLTWSLEDYIQFIKRIERQGVKGEVRVHHFIAEGTVDEAMMFRLGERAEEQNSLREAIKLYRQGELL